MNISRLLNSKYSKYILSFIIGLGLATLFRRVCDKKNCIDFKAPPVEEIKDKEYKYDNRCYSFKHTAVKCDHSKKIIHF